MSHQHSFVLLSSCLILSSFCASSADTIETTVQRTTTLSGSAAFNLPVTGNYLVVDPISGLLKGPFDPTLGLVDGRTVQAGLVIVDQPTGNLVAIIDSTGRPAELGAYDLNMLGQRLYPTAVVAPVFSPQFVVIDRRITMVDQITYRKSLLLKRVDDEYLAGRLSSAHVSRLKAQLDRVSVLEARYRKNGKLSSQRTRTLAEKLDQMEISLGKDIAIINERRARIGIRVN